MFTTWKLPSFIFENSNTFHLWWTKVLWFTFEPLIWIAFPRLPYLYPRLFCKHYVYWKQFFKLTHLSTMFHSIPPENVRKPKVFWRFQRGIKLENWATWVKQKVVFFLIFCFLIYMNHMTLKSWNYTKDLLVIGLLVKNNTNSIETNTSK